MTTILNICEIFQSIQGESSFAGIPCSFIRFSGCPLSCAWCDTRYALHETVAMPLTQVLEQVQAFRLPLVEITGGEPLAQPACVELAERLVDSGYKVLLETCGAYPIEPLPPSVIRIIDLKPPSSGQQHTTRWENLDHLRPQDEIKLLVADRRDYEWAREALVRDQLNNRCQVAMSPVFGVLSPRTIVEWILADQLPVRFQIQLQKYIWEPHQRGV